MRLAPLCLLACVPVLEDPTSIVDAPRVLAVTLEPPEVAPGDPVRATALYADATGRLTTADVDWGLCTATRPLAELGPIAPACVANDPDAVTPFGEGISVEGETSADACARFGPNPPPATDGAAAGRPADPDPTGGYYQPLLAWGGAFATLAPVRLRCGLPNVTQETYISWNLRYRSNRNPEVSSLRVGDAEAGDAPVAVPVGAPVALVATWPDCPSGGVCGDGTCATSEDPESCPDDCDASSTCGGAEPYVVLTDGELVSRRESISAAWFATGGAFDAPRGGAADGEGTDVETAWTAPAAGVYWLAVVLRDDRGGVGVREVSIIAE